MVEEVAIKTGDVEIRASVIVIISGGGANTVAFAAQPGAVCHVREGAVVIVVV